MAKIYLIIATRDVQYVEALIHFIRASEYNNKFIVKSFSTKENLEQFLNQSNNESVVLLVEYDMLPHTDYLLNRAVMILSEMNLVSSDIEAVSSIYKYQPLNQLLAQVYNTYLENLDGIIGKNIHSEKTKVFSVYSARLLEVRIKPLML